MALYEIQESGKRVDLISASTAVQALQFLNDDPLNPYIYDANGVEILPVPVGGGFVALGDDCQPLAFGDDAEDVLETARKAHPGERCAFTASMSPNLRKAFKDAGLRKGAIKSQEKLSFAQDLIDFLGNACGDTVAFAMTVEERAAFADA